MFSEDVVGLAEEIGFQPSSDECRAEVDRKGIPDDWCCNVKATTTELSSGPWHNHVSMLSRTGVWSDRDVIVGHRNAYVL